MEALEGEAPGNPARLLALGQGVFYLTTGVWPLVSIDTFQQVTGPKTDLWLVKTVGGLVGVIGGVLLASGLRKGPSRELAGVAAGAAATLTAIDLVYVSRRRIAPIYLLDAAAEIALIAGWMFTRPWHRG